MSSFLTLKQRVRSLLAPFNIMMTFKESVKTCLIKKYFSIKGRATRAEYWWFHLFSFLVILGPFLLIIPFVEKPSDMIFASMGILMVLLWIPNFCVTIRRLHDIGLSGWCYLVCLVPYVGGVILFVMTLLGSDKDNKWGPNPNSPSSEQSDERKDAIVTTDIDL